MEDELTAKMHSEFTVSKRIEIKHKAMCVWMIAGINADSKTLSRWCKTYGITEKNAMKWKDYCKQLIMENDIRKQQESN